MSAGCPNSLAAPPHSLILPSHRAGVQQFSAPKTIPNTLKIPAAINAFIFMPAKRRINRFFSTVSYSEVQIYLIRQSYNQEYLSALEMSLSAVRGSYVQWAAHGEGTVQTNWTSVHIFVLYAGWGED